MFKVKVSGLNNLKAEFSAKTEKVEKVVDQEMESMAKKWVNGAKRDAPADQGDLRRSISYYRESIARYSIVAQAFYAQFMEFGTKGKYRPIPGTEAIAAQFKGYKGGDIMQMIRMIVRWVHRKGITGTYSDKTNRRLGSKVNQYAEDYAAAWPIAMSILKHGVNPHPFFFKQGEQYWPDMVRRMKQRVEGVSRVAVIPPPSSQPRIIMI